jgi:hypothetical protein
MSVLAGLAGLACSSSSTPSTGSPCAPSAYLYEGNCVARGDTGRVDAGPTFQGGTGFELLPDGGVQSNCQAFQDVSPNVAMAYVGRIAGFPTFNFPTTWTSSTPVCTFVRPPDGGVANSFHCTFYSSNHSLLDLQFFDNPYPNPQDSSFTDGAFTFGLADAGSTGVLDMDINDTAYDGGSPPYWCGVPGGSGTFDVVTATYDRQEGQNPDHITANFTIYCAELDASITGCVSATE